MGFDFEGTFVEVVEQERIVFALEDDRRVWVTFSESDGQTTVREGFDAESEHAAEQQRAGWQAILDNFARHVEGQSEA